MLRVVARLYTDILTMSIWERLQLCFGFWVYLTDGLVADLGVSTVFEVFPPAPSCVREHPRASAADGHSPWSKPQTSDTWQSSPLAFPSIQCVIETLQVDIASVRRFSCRVLTTRSMDVGAKTAYFANAVAQGQPVT